MFKEGEGKGNGKGDRARARAKQCRKFQGKLTFDQQRKKHIPMHAIMNAICKSGAIVCNRTALCTL